MLQRVLSICLLVVSMLVAGCGVNGPAQSRSSGPDTGLRGHLLVIGGGLDDDNRPVYERFVALAKQAAKPEDRKAPRVVIATAASGNEEPNVTGKRQSISAYCPTCRIDAVMRATSTEETVALIDAASAMFFTGGDQKRIATRYLKDGQDTPESLAMRRLLARGGVIAGTSAGDAMMSDPMFYTGRSAEALGIRSNRTQRGEDDDADDKRAARELPLGPQIGQGMNLVPWVITDSHFFERHRFGRLVAACEASGKRLGLGVGEDACVEIDLATGECIGVSVADSLLVDAGGIERDNLTRRNIRAMVVQKGTRVSLPMRLRVKPNPAPAMPTIVDEVPVVEPGQNRQLASWRFFLNAQMPTAPGEAPVVRRLKLDGYEQFGWSAGGGWSVVEIRPL